MKKSRKPDYRKPLILLGVFLVYTILVASVDVQPIGPEGSSVGFAAVNGFFHKALGFNAIFYTLSKLIGYGAILLGLANAAWGIRNLIAGRSLKKAGNDILAAGCVYVLMAAAYALFEVVIINYRPVILDEGLEASYPSSHTFLAVTILTAAAFQLRFRIRDRQRRALIARILYVLAGLMVLCRFLSGVHWFTDILGGLLLGLALASLYLPIKYRLDLLLPPERRKRAKTRQAAAEDGQQEEA